MRSCSSSGTEYRLTVSLNPLYRVRRPQNSGPEITTLSSTGVTCDLVTCFVVRHYSSL
jgi:hypothetical protein